MFQKTKQFVKRGLAYLHRQSQLHPTATKVVNTFWQAVFGYWIGHQYQVNPLVATGALAAGASAAKAVVVKLIVANILSDQESTYGL